MALAVLSVVITPANELGKYIVHKLKRGFRYIREYNSYLSKLQEELRPLQGKIEDVERHIQKAERELKEPSKEMSEWLDRAQSVEKECITVTSNISTGNTCLNGLQDLCSRPRICKQILKLTMDISDLQKSGTFTVLAHDIPSPAVVPIGPRGAVENIPSRKHIMKEVIDALEDVNISSIGVYGMGGIGKTTLVTRINNELCANRRFKKVIMVTVSKDPNMKIIQDNIAERLDMKLEEQDMATRANKLCERLMSEESVLIILDDVWNAMEVGQIGLVHMSCKLIMTTRNADVCKRMKVQKVIKMAILTDDEAWFLFEEKAGDVVEFEATARKIVKRCRGSPLASAVLGSTLSAEKDKFVWDHVLSILEDPNAMGLEDIMPEVVTSLRLSYDRLPNPRVKLCFLYCCLFPEDYSIKLTDLRNYGIGEKFLKMTATLEGAMNELLYNVRTLKDCCLLLDGDDERSVKMHDVVRDVAILIASNSENGFLVNVGGGLKYLPESEKLHTYKRISYLNDDKIAFPDAFEYPHLRSLLFCEDEDEDEEEGISFEGMKSLVVLDMRSRYGWMIAISQSISRLKNLQTLYLEDCNLINKVHLIGGLTKLEVLSMRGSDIGELPVDIGNLINLKFLDLSDTSFKFVAPNVFSRLSNMEELFMRNFFDEWGTTGDGGKRNAEFLELVSSPRLSVLVVGEECGMSTCSVIRVGVDEFYNHESLEKHWISNVHKSEYDDVQIMYENLEKHWISNVLAISKKNLALRLNNCCGFKSVTDLGPAGSFNRLESLRVGACNDIENVIGILEGETSSEFFRKLTKLEVSHCPRICTILPSNLLSTENVLENLDDVEVRWCDEVQHVFSTEDNEMGILEAPEIQCVSASPVTTALLSRITKLSLSYLPKLKSIWNGVMPEGSLQGLKNLHVDRCPSLKYIFFSNAAGWLQSLEEIKIQNCGAMETIFCPIREEAEVTSLLPMCRLLSIDSCPKLSNIFPSSVAQHLHQLKELYISRCHSLRHIFGKGEKPSAMEHHCLLPELKYLEMRDLKSLIRFDQDNLPIGGPLEEIKVFVCPNLIRLPIQTVSSLKFIHAEDIWFRRLESEDENQASMLKPFFQPYFQVIPVPASHGIDEKLHTLLWMVAGLWLDDHASQLEGATRFRRLLSGIQDNTIEDVIRSGAGSCFVEFLIREDHTELQFEAACVLANIASRSSYCTKFVVPIFVKLLDSQNEDMREHAIWALGNVAGDSLECRDLVLGHGALIPLLAQLNNCAKVSILRNALWTISILFFFKPQPPFEQMKLALPALRHLLGSNDESVCSDACRALAFLLDGTSDKGQAVTEVDVFPQLVELLKHPSPLVHISALRSIRNIVCRDNWQSQCIIEHQALPYLLNLLTHHDVSIKRDACRLISNITAGNEEWIQLVIESNIIAPLVHLLETAEFCIKEQAARAISNATCHRSQEHIKHLVEQGCIKPFCDLLHCSDSSIIVFCLDGLVNILEVGETGDMGVMNRYVQIIDDSGGFKNIADLQSYDNREIQQKAVNILKYWQLENCTSSRGDAAEASFRSGKSESECVEKRFLRSTEIDGRSSLDSMLHMISLGNAKENNAEHDENGGNTFEDVADMLKGVPETNSSRLGKPEGVHVVSPGKSSGLKNPWSAKVDQSTKIEALHIGVDINGLDLKEKMNIVPKDYDRTGADDPLCMLSLGNAKYWESSTIELAKERQVDRMPEVEPHVIDIRSNASVKIDHNSPRSSSTKLAKESRIIQTLDQEQHFTDIESNASMKIDHNSPPSSSTELAKESRIIQTPDQEQHFTDIGSNGSMKIDHNSPPSSSTELAKESCIIQTPDQEQHFTDIGSNDSMKIDHNSPPSSSTELAKESLIIQTPDQEHNFTDIGSNASMKVKIFAKRPRAIARVSPLLRPPLAPTERAKGSHINRMPEQEGDLIDNSSNGSMKDNHESDSADWNSSQNVVIGESSSPATTSAHHEVWNDQSKNQSLFSTQESSSEYTITESIKILDAMDMNMNIGRNTYVRALKLLQEKGWREAFKNMSDARRKDLILSIIDGDI